MTLRTVALAIAAIATLAATPAAPNASNPFAEFAGNWTCTHRGDPTASTWHFAAPDDGGWTRVSYGAGGKIGGNAVVGYVPALHAWVYQDFHTDGSYADNTSAGDVGGSWMWKGVYYPAGGGVPLHGRVAWHVDDANDFTMYFYPLDSAKSNVPSGSQTCKR